EQRRAPRAVGERHVLAEALRDLVGVGRALHARREALDERLGVELEQPRVLELQRHVVDGEALRIARLPQLGADPGELSQSCPAAAPGTRGSPESAAA